MLVFFFDVIGKYVVKESYFYNIGDYWYFSTRFRKLVVYVWRFNLWVGVC